MNEITVVNSSIVNNVRYIGKSFGRSSHESVKSPGDSISSKNPVICKPGKLTFNEADSPELERDKLLLTLYYDDEELRLKLKEVYKHKPMNINGLLLHYGPYNIFDSVYASSNPYNRDKKTGMLVGGYLDRYKIKSPRYYQLLNKYNLEHETVPKLIGLTKEDRKPGRYNVREVNGDKVEVQYQTDTTIRRQMKNDLFESNKQSLHLRKESAINDCKVTTTRHKNYGSGLRNLENAAVTHFQTVRKQDVLSYNEVTAKRREVSRSYPFPREYPVNQAFSERVRTRAASLLVGNPPKMRKKHGIWIPVYPQQLWSESLIREKAEKEEYYRKHYKKQDPPILRRVARSIKDLYKTVEKKSLEPKHKPIKSKLSFTSKGHYLGEIEVNTILNMEILYKENNQFQQGSSTIKGCTAYIKDIAWDFYLARMLHDEHIQSSHIQEQMAKLLQKRYPGLSDTEIKSLIRNEFSYSCHDIESILQEALVYSA